MAQGQIQFMQLPALQANRLLSFAPIMEGMDSLDNKLRYREQQDIAAQQRAEAKARSGGSDQRQQVELFGRQAKAVSMIADPARRAAIWGRLVSKHPNAKGLSAEYLDPTTGPELVMAEAGQWSDPAEAEATKLELDYKRAQIEKMRAEAAAPSGGVDYGKTGTIFQGPDGKMYAARWAADGTQKVVEITTNEGQGLTPFRGVGEVDTGTGTRIIDRATGQDVRTIDKDLVGAERAKVIGRETGEGQMQLPKTATALQQYELQDDAVNAAIDKAKELADGTAATGAPSQVTGFIGGTPAYNLARQLDTVKGNIGFDKLQNLRDNSPTGGALGQVAVQELQMLQATLGSLDQAQSKEEFKAGLDQIKKIRADFRRMKRDAYQRDVKRFGAANVPNPDTGVPSSGAGVPSRSSNSYVYNPETGELEPQ